MPLVCFINRHAASLPKPHTGLACPSMQSGIPIVVDVVCVPSDHKNEVPNLRSDPKMLLANDFWQVVDVNAVPRHLWAVPALGDSSVHSLDCQLREVEKHIQPGALLGNHPKFVV